MVLSVNQELCTGCGICVDACPNGALCLLDGKAVIDDTLCTECETCVSLCPVGAIQKATIPATQALQTERVIPVSVQSLDKAPRPQKGAWLGMVLSFVGQEILPRLLDGLELALEKREAGGLPKTNTIVQNKLPSPSATRLRKRRQYRRGSRNRKIERRL